MPSSTSAGQLITFAVDKRQPFTRASKPKVRTGCITCRRRRKKCDEGKPACLTCLKYTGHCEGYQSSGSKVQARPSQQRIIHPKIAGKPKKGDILIEPNYSSLVFTNQLEKDSFDYWMAFTRTTTLFHSDLLTSIIPQISWKDPAIKHAALAIGAAALGSKTRQQRLLGKGKFQSDALRHYGKSLNLLYSSPMSYERSLLACLLFIAFETLRGNRSAGLSHMNHGSQILDQYHPQGETPTPLLKEVMSSFQHFGLQAWSHSGSHPVETDEKVPWCCRGRGAARYAVDEMPATFENLDIARRWWDITRHFVKYHAPLKTSFEIAQMAPQPIDPEKLANYGSPESQQRVRGFLRHLDAWNASFIPLAARVERAKHTNNQEFIRALALRIDYLYVWSGVRSGGWADVKDVARMAPAFRDVVKLSRQYLELQGQPSDGQERFTLEDSPTWALALSFVMCKEPDVRNDILMLFKQYPRRDGLWDTRIFVLLLQWMNRLAAKNFYPEDERHILGSKVVFHDHSHFVLEKTRWDPVSSSTKTYSIKFSVPIEPEEE